MNEQYERIKETVNERRCCDACRWCIRDELNDLICANSDSHKCADWVETDYMCGKWERKN